MILPELEQLTRRSWWTVGSQPAINGVSSSDETVGWGPKAGYVFQKGFESSFVTKRTSSCLNGELRREGKDGYITLLGITK